MSNSKKKKESRRKAERRAKRKKSIAILVGGAACLVLVFAAAWVIFYNIGFSIRSHQDYSVGLNEDGTITGIAASNFVKLCDLDAMTFSEKELVPSDEDFDNYLVAFMAQFGLTPEDFDDAFVEEYYSSLATSAEDFKEQYKEEQKQSNLDTAILNYLGDHCTIDTYPEAYVQGLMGLLKGVDENQYEMMNRSAESSSGKKVYSSFREYTGYDNKEYYASLRWKAEQNATVALILQAIMEQEKIEVNEEHYSRVLSSYGIAEEYASTLEDAYGRGFLHQAAIRFAVMDYLKEKAVIEKE